MYTPYDKYRRARKDDGTFDDSPSAPVPVTAQIQSGTRIISGSEDGSLRIFNAETGEACTLPLRMPHRIFAVAVSRRRARRVQRRGHEGARLARKHGAPRRLAGQLHPPGARARVLSRRRAGGTRGFLAAERRVALWAHGRAHMLDTVELSGGFVDAADCGHPRGVGDDFGLEESCSWYEVGAVQVYVFSDKT